MSEESKLTDAELNKDTLAHVESVDEGDSNEDEKDDTRGAQIEGETGPAKKKKSKKAKLKKALGRKDGNAGEGSSTNPSGQLTTGMMEQMLEMNPSLKSEVAGMDKDKAAEKLKSLDVASLLTGMVG